MIICPKCETEYEYKPKRCQCGYRFPKEALSEKGPTFDRICRYTHDGLRCPAPQNGDGYCDWHSNPSDESRPSHLNYLLSHGVPRWPDWRKLFVAWSDSGIKLEECRERIERLESTYRLLPKLPVEARRKYDEEVSSAYRKFNEMCRKRTRGESVHSKLNALVEEF